MNNVFEGNFGNKEKPKKYFKLKLISPEGLYVPCFVCEANDKEEAKVQAEAVLEADLKRCINLKIQKKYLKKLLRPFKLLKEEKIFNK